MSTRGVYVVCRTARPLWPGFSSVLVSAMCIILRHVGTRSIVICVCDCFAIRVPLVTAGQAVTKLLRKQGFTSSKAARASEGNAHRTARLSLAAAFFAAGWRHGF